MGHYLIGIDAGNTSSKVVILTQTETLSPLLPRQACIINGGEKVLKNLMWMSYGL